MAAFGEILANAIADYLKANGLTSLGQINRTILTEIAQRTYNHHQAMIQQKEEALSNEEWLARLQKKEGEMGLDVKKEYAFAQAWYENNGAVLTRRKFMEWLKKADRPLNTGNPKADKPPVRLDPYIEPSFDWRRLMATKWPRETHPDRPAYEEMAWGEVSLTVRQEILRASPHAAA